MPDNEWRRDVDFLDDVVSAAWTVIKICGAGLIAVIALALVAYLFT